MSTNAIDHTKKLNDARNDYLDNVQKQSRDHKHEVENIEQKNQYIVNKQAKNFAEAKNNLENTVKDRLDVTAQSNKEALEKKQESYQHEINQERDRFINERNANQKDIARKFDDVKSNYRTIIDSKDKYNENMAKESSQTYSDRLENISNQYNKSVSDIQEKSFGSGGELAKKFQDDKNRIIKDKNAEIESLVSTDTKKSNQFKEKINKDLENVRQTNALEVNTIKENAQNTNKLLLTKHDQDQKNLLERFTDMNSNVVKQQSEQNNKLNQEMRNRVQELNSGHARDLKSQQNKFKMNNDGMNENVKEYDALKQSELTKRSFEKQIAQNRKHTELVESEFIDQNRNMSSKFENDLKSKSVDFSAKIEKLNAQKNLESLRDRVENSQKTSSMQDRYVKRALIKEQEQEAVLNQQNSQVRERENKLKKDFGRTVNDLNHRSQIALEDVKSDSTLDKKKFMTEVTTRTEQERTELKKNFETKTNSMMRNYEKQIDQLRNENIHLHQDKIDKIEIVKKTMQDKFDAEKEFLVEKQNLDLAEVSKRREQREKELNSIIDGMHDQYGKKINDMSYRNNSAMDTFTKKYEEKLSQQKKDFINEMKQKEQAFAAEIAFVKQNLESENSRTVNRHESSLSLQKKNYEDQIERLKNYNQSQQKDGKTGWG